MSDDREVERFERLVRRIAAWSDEELAAVCPRQVRHVARVVIDGADPIYPPFEKLGATA